MSISHDLFFEFVQFESECLEQTYPMLFGFVQSEMELVLKGSLHEK